MITPQELRDLLAYDLDTGALTYRKAAGRWGVIPAGAMAGCVNPCGYVQVMIQRRALLGHRIAWALTHGSWPEGQIDHINGIRTDNRIANLRDVSHAGNLQNRHRSNVTNTLGMLGVSQQSKRRFRAKIKANGVKHNLGSFDTAEAAHAAYLDAKARLSSL